MSLYQELIAAGVEVSNHFSDLYCPVNETTKPILARSTLTRSTFVNQAPPHVGELWYDVPFAYEPFWEKAGFVSRK
jgi:hypothetical protein